MRRARPCGRALRCVWRGLPAGASAGRSPRQASLQSGVLFELEADDPVGLQPGMSLQLDGDDDGRRRSPGCRSRGTRGRGQRARQSHNADGEAFSQHIWVPPLHFGAAPLQAPRSWVHACPVKDHVFRHRRVLDRGRARVAEAGHTSRTSVVRVRRERGGRSALSGRCSEGGRRDIRAPGVPAHARATPPRSAPRARRARSAPGAPARR